MRHGYAPAPGIPQIAPHKVRKEECWGYRWKLHSHWNYFMGRHLPPDSWSPLVWVESERAESELTSSKGWKQLVCRKWWISSEFVFLCWLPPCFWFPVLRHSIYMCFLWSWEIGTRRKIYRELAKGWIYSFGGGRKKAKWSHTIQVLVTDWAVWWGFISSIFHPCREGVSRPSHQRNSVVHAAPDLAFPWTFFLGTYLNIFRDNFSLINYIYIYIHEVL